MARVTPGPTVGQISGSIGATVFSHNRYGSYVRLRTVPTNPKTAYQLGIRAILSACSSAWKALDDASKVAWAAWAQTNPINDRLGMQQVLAPNVAYIGLNSRIIQAGGAAIDVPPVTDAPQPLLTLSLDADIGAGDVQVTYTVATLGATEKLWVQAAVTESPAITYVQNRLKLVVIGAAATASPLVILDEIEVRFGSLQVGQLVTVQCSVLDGASGLLSVPLRASAVVELTV